MKDFNGFPSITMHLEIDELKLSMMQSLNVYLAQHNETIRENIAAQIARTDIEALIYRQVDIELRKAIEEGVSSALRYDKTFRDRIAEQVGEYLAETWKARTKEVS